MKTPSVSPARLLRGLSLGVFGCAVGWFARDAFSPLAASPVGSTSAPTAVAAAHARSGGAVSSLSATVAVEPLLDRLLFADSTDMVGLVESLGELTRLDESGVRLAWRSLGRRNPVDTMGGSAAVVYLWSRMVALDASTAMPRGWGADNFASTIELVRVRTELPALLARLQGGENLSDAERRAVFIDLARSDPLGAVKLWTAETRPWDFRNEARWLGAALADPETRDAAMAELRVWQKGGDIGGATLALAWDWIARDPAAVERWLQRPEQADVRGVVMQQVLNVRVAADPLAAWSWSEALPESERRRAIGMSAAQFANRDPAAGARLIAGLSLPAEREEAVREYGKTLAANDLAGWKIWRDTLPPAEQAQTNPAAFDLWVFHEPEVAVKWLQTQAAGAAKDDMVLTLVDVYAARDPAVAATWIESIADPARRKNAAIAALASVGPQNLDTVRTFLAAAGTVE